MSAINDALRRASSAGKSPSAAPVSTATAVAATATPVPPAYVSAPPQTHATSEPVAPPICAPVAPPILPPMGMELPPLPHADVGAAKKNGKLLAVLCVVLLLGAAAAAGLWAKKRFWSNDRKQHTTANAKAEENVAANISISAHKPVRLVETETRPTAPATSSVAAVSPASARPVAPAATPQPAVTTAPPLRVAAIPVKFPALRLQSIFYKPSNPSVIINGKTLFISDEISGVTVADIQAASVTLVLSGQTNILTLR
jgi:hypothetical protein